MVTYYQGPDALITHEVFEIRSPQLRRYPLADLHDVHVVKEGRDPFVPASLAVAAAVSIMAAATWLLPASPATWFTVVALGVTPAAVGGVWWRKNRPYWILRATYRHYQVELFRCSDQRTFGQVRRGLLRALEGVRGW